MKKNIAVLLSILFVLSALIVSSSINGQYKGHEIVKLKANGKELTVEDVPAFIYDSRTMVPVGLLRQTGLEVIWNQQEYSVDVIVPSDHSNHITILKAYNKIRDHYNKLESLGSLIAGLSDSFRLTMESIDMNYEPYKNLELSYTHLENVIDAYNDILDGTNYVISYAASFDQNISDMNEILRSYYNAIDYYKLSYQGLEDYYFYSSDANFFSYLDNSSLGFNTSSTGRTTSLQGHLKYHNMIDNY